MGGTLFRDRADEGKAVGRAHSGDIVPANGLFFVQPLEKV
jgi:hypothetical protein